MARDDSDYDDEEEEEEEVEEEEEYSASSPSEEDSDDEDFVPESKGKKKASSSTPAAAAKKRTPGKPKTSKSKGQAVKKKKPAVARKPAAAKKMVVKKEGGGKVAVKKEGSSRGRGGGGGGGGSKAKKATAASTSAEKPKKKRASAPTKRRKATGGDDDDPSDDDDDDDDDNEEDDDAGDGEEEDGEARGGGARKGKGKAKRSGGGGKGGGGKDPEADRVLKQVRKLMLEMAEKNQQPPSLKDLGITNVREVVDMSPSRVMLEIEKLVLQTSQSILKGEAFSYTVPTRSTGNQLYIEELDRIVLTDKVAQRSFLNHSTVRKTALTTRVIQLVHEVLDKGIHITKRDMFYTDVKLFQKQKESDVVLEDVACMLGCPRSCLNVVASEKGLVVGRVQFEEDGDFIDCTRMGVGGKAIPPYIDKITNVQSDAKFILLIEKEAAFLRLAEDRFYNKFPCIVITGKGQPDVATRLFVKRLKSDLKIPLLGLFDSDPWGLSILTTYISGSKNMSYDSASLTAGEIKWLGVRPSDLDRYNLPEQCRLDMSESDLERGEQLLKEDFVKKNPEWVKELQLMLKTKKKAEIQALSAFGFQFITEQYLPQKLARGDWI